MREVVRDGTGPVTAFVPHCPDGPNCRRREVGGGDAELEKRQEGFPLPTRSQMDQGFLIPATLDPPDYLVSPS